MADISFEVEANKVHISSEEQIGIYFYQRNLIINPNEYFEIKKRIMSKEYGFFVEKRNFVSEVTVMRIVRG